MNAQLTAPSQAEVRRAYPPGQGVESPVRNGAAGALPEPSTAVAPPLLMADWNDLLDAVMERLRSDVHDPLLHSDPSPSVTLSQTAREAVLGCVAALDQLHASVRQELGRRQRLELEVFDLQTALARVQVELAGTRAGEQHARRLAMHDVLTSLPNRSLFHERLDQALGPDCPTHGEVAVLFIDLDDFKPINDLHGHAVGDEVLRIVAMRLKRAVRAGDLVSRLGGDEFACLLADKLDRSQLMRLSCQLFDAVSAPLSVGGLRLSVTPSIGIAVQTGGHAHPGSLLQRADAAMYRAKRDRSGVAFCDGGATRLGA